jgi:putative DNA primase/helicase
LTGSSTPWLAEKSSEGPAVLDNVKELRELEEEIRPAEFSDDTLALHFTAEHLGDLRYVDKWGRWLVWDGKRWSFDETVKVFDMVRETCREQAHRCNDPRVKAQLTSAKTVGAVHRLAQVDQRTAAVASQWDADPWLLNTPDGVYDLRSGERRDTKAEDYMTKIAAVAPDGDCPRFRTFLAEITDGNAELQQFIRRVLGYCLTGVTREHALFFNYGTGANGKGTLMNTVAHIMGEYHKAAPIETFTVTHGERHPTELAGLVGARLVTATETEKGRRWAEARIKQLTGGDAVSARFMRQDFFEYVPQFKLNISGNHKPTLSTVDEAIRRRFNMLPFTVTIAPDRRDLDLPEKLKAEAPGILQWMIDGCLAWQERGLDPPAAVTEATNEYLDSQDLIALWIGDCCEEDKAAQETPSKLFASYKEWAEAANERPGSQKGFGDVLQAKGFAKDRTMHGRYFKGLRVASPSWKARNS